MLANAFWLGFMPTLNPIHQAQNKSAVRSLVDVAQERHSLSVFMPRTCLICVFEGKCHIFI